MESPSWQPTTADYASAAAQDAKEAIASLERRVSTLEKIVLLLERQARERDLGK